MQQIRVDWPREVKTLSLRKHERVPVRRSCKIFTDKRDYPDVLMIDIATGGCALEGNLDLATGDAVTVTIPLEGPGVPPKVRAVVRNVAPAPAGIRAGLQFQDVDDSDSLCLEIAITHRLQDVRAERNQRAEVLLFEQPACPGESLSQRIPAGGIGIKRCDSLVEGCYLALALGPRAIVMADALCSLSPLEAGRLLARSKECTGIPVFVRAASAEEAAGSRAGGANPIEYFVDADDLLPKLRRLFPAGEAAGGAKSTDSHAEEQAADTAGQLSEFG